MRVDNCHVFAHAHTCTHHTVNDCHAHTRTVDDCHMCTCMHAHTHAHTWWTVVTHAHTLAQWMIVTRAHTHTLIVCILACSIPCVPYYGCANRRGDAAISAKVLPGPGDRGLIPALSAVRVHLSFFLSGSQDALQHASQSSLLLLSKDGGCRRFPGATEPIGHTSF